jgi:hypothetical protein
MAAEERVDPNFLRVQQIQAENRTTTAVRGLLKVVLYEATGLLIGGVIWGYSVWSDSSGGIILGGLVIIGGTIAAVVAGHDALSNSKVASRHVPGVQAPKGWVER